MKIFNEIKLAQELIRFPTVKTEDKGIIKFLIKKLTAIGFKCTIIKSKGSVKISQNRATIKIMLLPLLFIVQLLLNKLMKKQDLKLQ